MNSSAKQILIGWIYRRIGFLKRGMKKQIKPLAAILRFLDFSPPILSFRAQREIFLALCSFLLLSQKVSPFPLSHIRRYTGVPERSLGFARDDVAEVAFPPTYSLYGTWVIHPPIPSFPAKSRNHPCTPLVLASFADGFPFPAVAHRTLYQCARRIPPLRSG